ncbi:MAG: lysophospholipid acyltransferase family protein [Bacteroidales bacterium]|nr:lysophospholipid acyltransferase family protein [Bacteroidales bacterium]
MKDKLLYYLYAGLFGTLARLPLSWLYALSDGLYWIITHLWHYRRRVVRDNLQRVFPDRSPEERLAIEHAFYHHLCDIIFEIIKLLHISDEELKRRIEVRGTEQLDECARQGHPIFLLTGHYGNWEWAQHIYSFLKEDITCTQIYRPTRDWPTNELMLHLRGRFNSTCIRQKQAVRTILRMKKDVKPFLTTFVADQHPNSEIMKHWTTFLGQDSMYITGAEEIGRKVDAQYFYVDIRGTGRGRYLLECREVQPVEGEEFPYTIGYLHMMEDTILRQPELWLWSHRRWYISHEEYNKKMEKLKSIRK